MGYEMKLVRSFSTVEPQKLRFGLLTGCFLVSLTYFSMTKPYAIPIPTINSRLSSTLAAPIGPLFVDTATSPLQSGAPENGTEESKLRCNVSDPKSVLCKKDDVVTMEKNSTTTYEAPPSRGQETQGAQQLGSNNKTKERSVIHDPKPVPYGEVNTAQKIENVAGTMDRRPIRENPSSFQYELDGAIKVVENSSTIGIRSTQKVDSRMDRRPIRDDPKYEIHGAIRVAENSTTTGIGSTQTVHTSYSNPFGRTEDVKPERKPICDVSDRRTDVCEMDGDVRIIGKNSTVIYVTSNQMGNPARNESWRVRPYARKSDGTAMANVRKVSVRSLEINEEAPRCTLDHTVPAIVFSIAGYTGNFFHDFTDVLVPLFLTSRQFDGEVQFLVTNFRSWWINKYLPIFRKLSRYEIIDFDKDDRVHCFRHAMVGLRSHKDLTIDPSRSPNGYSMVEFTKFMRSTYSLSRDSPMRVGEIPGKKPRLLIIARSRTRKFTNLNKIVRMAEKSGYEVVVAENDGGSNITRFASIVNSCDVMMGVHGAGLTNLVFLPTSAILIQILPWGKLEWIAGNYFREPAKDMKLRYMEYSISEEESTLIEQYPRDHPVFKDPMSIHKLGWTAMEEIYLVKQNVKLDVRRFRRVLSKAFKTLRQ